MKSDAGTSVKRDKVRLAPDDGVFELPGAEPAWIWVHTCPKPECECRSALVLATNAGRKVLLQRGAAVHAAWSTGEIGYYKFAAKLDNLLAFHIDIDTAEVFALEGDKPLDLARHPLSGALAERIDGDLLDSIGRLWYRGKGWTDPEQQTLLAKKAKIRGWRPGEMLAWDDVCTGVRQDYYVLEDRLYEAVEMYCPVPDCECGEVVVAFETRVPRGAPSPWHVSVQHTGATKIEPYKKYHDRLDQLWAAFQKRHPNYRARFARRYGTMKSIGARIAATHKVGRNDPCPCGSGKKYKRCCASSP